MIAVFNELIAGICGFGGLLPKKAAPGYTLQFLTDAAAAGFPLLSLPEQ
ncbi:hypothetical protein G5B37_07840 [Rasiella rasia]|uniref:Uncharacterized protein n=1 Tax=Rasiella rasia TaxID=2744027 RepID=A0A6G6GLL0_9FLAO|nr:hypothetical protein [Rasiella rasia]QIE59476.1 hypothetical protein G5B37_07840 [Rasiella rasia]